MRVLLLQPEDVPESGPWSQQHWDLIVDLGKSSDFSAEKWARQCGCPVLRTDSFRHGVTDGKRVREILSAGRGRVMDEQGIDWWELITPLLVPPALTLLALQAAAKNIDSRAELWATRPGGVIGMLEAVLDRKVQDFGSKGGKRFVARAVRYAGLLRRFRPAQIKEIVLDKYDPGYRWRSRFAARQESRGEPVILLPSAYENVSRMAAAFARFLPKQSFLLVATRESAKKFVPTENVQVRDLAAYARSDFSVDEAPSLVDRWNELKGEFEGAPELQMLLRAGVLDSFPEWIRDGLATRNAWLEVLDREPVCAVLCGDDSNRYTRLPVSLAARRKIPTMDFHHGALDGWYVVKDLPCDLYLAKNEMERDYLLRVCDLPPEKIVVCAPASEKVHSEEDRAGTPRTSMIFFSEPYEVAGMRTREVYREVLPRLCRVAREHGRRVVLKLHPFERISERSAMIREILTAEDCEVIRLVDGPITPELMGQAWCGITVESTTVIDCMKNRVCCFLCSWLAHSSFEYVQQYARFGVGEVLERAEQILEIPRRLADSHNLPTMKLDLSPTVDPAILQSWLTAPHDRSGARSLS